MLFFDLNVTVSVAAAEVVVVVIVAAAVANGNCNRIAEAVQVCGAVVASSSSWSSTLNQKP